MTGRLLGLFWHIPVGQPGFAGLVELLDQLHVGPADDTDYATCQMWGNEKIRRLHTTPFAAFLTEIEAVILRNVQITPDWM